MRDELGPPPLERKGLRWLLGTVLVLVAAALLFARTVDRDLNHDEHQFLAPAALLARQGLQPWRDYPLFHLPNLVFAYAAADRITGDLILGAKLVCFAATALAFAGLAIAAMRTRRLLPAVLLTAAALLLLLGDPLFRYTAGKTWNHEVPAALLLGAMAALAGAARRESVLLTALAGILAGLATGCRLTFAPVLIGLFLFTWLFPLPIRRRAIHAFVLTTAATLALAPSFYYLLTQPEAFIFGNFEFPRLRLLDPNDTRARETVVWWRKIRFFVKEVVRESWPIFILWAAVAVRPAWRWLRAKDGGDVTAAVVLICAPFALLGCYTPSRYQYQHYFVFIPLLVYGTVAGIRSLQGRWQWFSASIAALLGVFVAGRAAEDYTVIRSVSDRKEWFPSKAKAFGERLRDQSGTAGRILTLGPAFPLSGGLDIYPELATGTFGWRAAHLLPMERRGTMHLIAPEDIAERMAAESPTAILTGVEDAEEEKPLIDWAQQNHYRAVDLKKMRTLWLPPAP